MTYISSNKGAFKSALESIHVTDTYCSCGESCFQRKLSLWGYAYTKLKEKKIEKKEYIICTTQFQFKYYLLQRKQLFLMELRVVLISLTNFIISKMFLIQKCCSITPKPKGIILDYNATVLHF